MSAEHDRAAIDLRGAASVEATSGSLYVSREHARRAGRRHVLEIVALSAAAAGGALLASLLLGWGAPALAGLVWAAEMLGRWRVPPPFDEEEGYFRPGTAPGSVYELRPHHTFRYFYYRRGLGGLARTVEFTTNAHGLRERDLAVPKPPGTWRALVVGDSVAFGHGVAVEEAFPRVLEGLLQEPEGPRREVVNAAVTGYNASLEAVLLERLAPLYGPDVVLVSYSLDDALRIRRARVGDGEAARKGLVDRVLYRATRHSGLARMVAAGRLPRRLAARMRELYADDSPGWAEARRALADMARTAAAAGARILVAINPVFPLLGPDYPLRDAHQRIVAFCRERGVPVVDLLDTFEGWNGRHAVLEPLDVHPSPAVHRRIAVALCEALSGGGLLGTS